MKKSTIAVVIASCFASFANVSIADTTNFGESYLKAKNESIAPAAGAQYIDAKNDVNQGSNFGQRYIDAKNNVNQGSNFGQRYIDAKNEKSVNVPLTGADYINAKNETPIMQNGQHLDGQHAAIEPGAHLDRNSADLTASQAAVGEARKAKEVNRTNSQVVALQASEGQALALANQERVVNQTADLQQPVKDLRSDVTTLAQGIEQTRATGEYAQSRADSAYANTQANRQALNATNRRVADNTAELANHESRIQSLESTTSSKFADLNKQVDDNRKRASAGIAGVAAMANVPQVIQGQTFSVGAGLGTTDGESALAVGFSSRASEHVVVKASVSDDTQQNFVVGGGISYGW